MEHGATIVWTSVLLKGLEALDDWRAKNLESLTHPTLNHVHVQQKTLIHW